MDYNINSANKIKIQIKSQIPPSIESFESFSEKTTQARAIITGTNRYTITENSFNLGNHVQDFIKYTTSNNEIASKVKRPLKTVFIYLSLLHHYL